MSANATLETVEGGLDVMHITIDWGDPLGILVPAVWPDDAFPEGFDPPAWDDFTWRAQARPERKTADVNATFEVTDQGTTADDLRILLELADTTVLKPDVRNYFDVRALPGSPFPGLTVGRGWITPLRTVTEVT